MRGGKWSPEEEGPTGMALPSSPPPSASVDRDSVKTRTLGNQDSFFLGFFPPGSINILCFQLTKTKEPVTFLALLQPYVKNISFITVLDSYCCVFSGIYSLQKCFIRPHPSLYSLSHCLTFTLWSFFFYTTSLLFSESV